MHTDPYHGQRYTPAILNDIGEGLGLTPAETASVLRVKKNTLAFWRCKRTDGPPFIKVGSRVLYPIEPLRQWLEANTARSTFEKR